MKQFILISLFLYFIGCASFFGGSENHKLKYQPRLWNDNDEYANIKKNGLLFWLDDYNEYWGPCKGVLIYKVVKPDRIQYILSFDLTFPNWRFLKHVIFIIDGKQYTLYPCKIDHDVKDSSDVKEQVYYFVTRDFIKLLSNASSVKFKIYGDKDNYENEFKPEIFPHLKNLNNSM